MQQLQTRSEAHVTLISLHVCSMFVMSSTKWDFRSMSSPRLLDFLKSFTFSYHFNIAKNSLFHCIHTPIKLCGNTKHQAKAITSCVVNIYIWEEKKEEEKKSPLGQTHPDIKFRIYYLRFLDLKGNHFSFVSMLAYISVSGLKPLQQYVLFDFIKSIFTYQNIFIVCNWFF